jgi:predicted ester cyclase
MDLQELNKMFVIGHFHELVNEKNVSVIAKNFLSNFVDHEGPNGEPIGVEAGRVRMAALGVRFPDLHVDLRDVIAEGDKVVVRGIWTGTDSKTGERMEFHGFVLWRIENGRFAERWATATEPSKMSGPDILW